MRYVVYEKDRLLGVFDEAKTVERLLKSMPKLKIKKVEDENV